MKVLDVAGSNGLYSLVGKRGLYFKNSKGYDGTSGALGQVLTLVIAEISVSFKHSENLIESAIHEKLRNFGRYDRRSRVI